MLSSTAASAAGVRVCGWCWPRRSLSNYGIYGPAYRIAGQAGRAQLGSEEYLDSEKYQLRHWDLERTGDSIRGVIGQLNDDPAHANAGIAIRMSEPGLPANIANDPELIAYVRSTRPTTANIVLTIVNLDPAHNEQSGWVRA